MYLVCIAKQTYKLYIISDTKTINEILNNKMLLTKKLKI